MVNNNIVLTLGSQYQYTQIKNVLFRLKKMGLIPNFTFCFILAVIPLALEAIYMDSFMAFFLKSTNLKQ